MLNRDIKNYGKKYLIDGSQETCWNSDNGSPQWISMEFDQLENISKLFITFQGGFASNKCHIVGDSHSLHIYPNDDNLEQVFEIGMSTKKLKITFVDSTDLFGRIVVYSLKLE